MQKTWVQSRVGKIPWRRERLPTPLFYPGEFHGLYSPWGGKGSDTTEGLLLHFILDHEAHHWRYLGTEPGIAKMALLYFFTLSRALFPHYQSLGTGVLVWWIFPGILLKWSPPDSVAHLLSNITLSKQRADASGSACEWDLELPGPPGQSPQLLVAGHRVSASGNRTRKNSVILRLVTYITEANHMLGSISIFKKILLECSRYTVLC